MTVKAHHDTLGRSWRGACLGGAGTQAGQLYAGVFKCVGVWAIERGFWVQVD